jgi:hypothetical protein
MVKMSKKQRVLAYIKENGPITAIEVTEDMQDSKQTIAAFINKLKYESSVYIAHYKRVELNGRLYPRPYYAAGPAPDGYKEPKKPAPLTPAQYRERKDLAHTNRVNSVFSLGVQKKKRTRVGVRPPPEEYTRTKLLAFITENGPVSAAEVSFEMKLELHAVRSHMSAMRRQGKLYLDSYRREESFGRAQVRPLYKAGPPPENYKEPKKPARLSKSEHNKRFKSKRKVFVSSVFQLGVPVEKRRFTNTKRPDIVERHGNAGIAD